MTQQAAFHLHITSPFGPPESLELRSGETTIGREEDNTLVLRHEMVSRHHARIECTPAGGCFIIDQRSTNGTLVNGVRLVPDVPMPLAAGTKVAIGLFELTVEQIPVAALPLLPADLGPAGDVELQPSSAQIQPPPQPPPPPPPATDSIEPTGEGGGGLEGILPGLRLHSQRLLQYLPDIYQASAADSILNLSRDGDHEELCYGDTDFSPSRFMSRFLALFESVLLPIEWTVGNFDLFLHPRTAPAGFLPWLANWFEITCDESWTEQQLRDLLAEAHQIYARRGTRWALSRMLEIYVGQPPVITDDVNDQEPHSFYVGLPGPDSSARRANIQAIIDAHKPAHTIYKLEFLK